MERSRLEHARFTTGAAVTYAHISYESQKTALACSPKTGPGAMRVFRLSVARRTLDETDTTHSRADHQKAAGRGWHAGGWPDDRRSLPSPRHQRADVPALAPAVRRHEG